jgi:hypothetical protein
LAVVERCLRALGGASAPPAATTWAAVAALRLPLAVSEAGARVLLDQAEGALDRALAALANAADAAARARELAELGAAARPFLTPPRVVLAGPVNAGKSTLFNVLAGRERVLASPLPGTTRDVVRELVQDGELVIELVDTAGRRELEPSSDGAQAHVVSRSARPREAATEAEGAVGRAEPIDEVAPESAAIERAGQRLGARVASTADLVLWCSPTDAPAAVPSEFEGLRLVLLATRADLGAAPGAGQQVSAVDAPTARRVVWRAIRAALQLRERPWVSGRAVAFDARLAERLASTARAGDEATRRASAAGEFAPSVALRESAPSGTGEPRV